MLSKGYLILILVFSGLVAQSQQMFTQIPHQGFSSVYDAVEIGSNYFFGSVNVGYRIHKTDLIGNIKDSVILFENDSIGRIVRLKKDSIGFLTLFTYTQSIFDPSYYSAHYKLGRIRYDSNLNFIDSFNVTIPLSSFKSLYLWKVWQFDDKIYYVVHGNDTLQPPLYEQDRIFVLDTLGNYLFQKSLISGTYNIDDLIANGQNFLTVLGSYRLLDDSLNTIKTGTLPNSYKGSTALDKYSEDKFISLYAKSYAVGQPLNTDSFCVEMRDTNFNLIKMNCLPRHAIFSNYPNLPGSTEKWFDGKYKDNIYAGSSWGTNGVLGTNSYFTVTNLDSNLNIRWSNVYGGDMPYQIERYYSTSDGGCFVLGARRLANSSVTEPVVFKISQQGLITNITSFAKSAQSYFRIYPNPNMGIAHIKNSSGKNYELLILNQEGKVIKRTLGIKEESHRIDLSQQASGIYFYKIFTSDGRSAGGKISVK